MGPEDVAWAVPLGFFTMVTALAVGVPLVRALARRWESEAGQPRVPAEVAARLERMEQALESVAIEVERISEGQRFTTRLLSERARDPVLPNGAGDQGAR
ncbi:MAG: hypothetical protein AVDCRST_MAG11-3198 [uncultured Gemmatimonadaceae bacterium]|uniref:Uncharacterized protein n=1 Tax=uncultured Gemmatimonadaceae bacterium TaxID=246130 RepID=A0A6J4LZ93_9BACT|nr:MAG: hypothetical protein AVDCRST_MAG11-3198 [uncultured Gemmatimonadaceae bacterium]